MANSSSRALEWTVWFGLAATAAVILLAYIASKPRAQPLPIYGQLPEFVLTNQDSQPVTLNSFSDRVWIADVIFTRCPSQCLLMSQHMKEIQDQLHPDDRISLVSFTTDPTFDQPPVLKKYSDRFKAAEGRWSFLTGTKSDLHKVEVDGLRLAVLDKPADQQEMANDLFIHSQKFVLLDQRGQIRWYYDGEKPEAVAEIIAAARKLARE